MSNHNIRMIVVLGAFVITGIFCVQLYWLQQAFSVRNKQFDQSVKISLSRISNAIQKEPSRETSFTKIEQHASNYYVLRLNGKVDTNLLGQVIKKEFSYSNIQIPTQYAIYDSSTQQLVYGDVISDHKLSDSQNPTLPVLRKGEYYLGISFPSLLFRLSGEMYIWVFSTFVLLVFLLFYVYVLFIILKQKRLSEIQRDFVNNLTHEFKTPLSTISLVADTLNASPETHASFAPFLDIVKQESEKLNAQVDKILLSGKSSSLQLGLKKELIDLNELIKSMMTNLTYSLNQPVQVQYELTATNTLVLADKSYTVHAIRNLLDNAIKYSCEQAFIKVSTENKGANLLLSISDNGIGIDSRYKNKIFDPFFRIPTGNVHTVRGFGIGLHFVKNIVKAHRWKIFFTSELNKGSRFTLQIPV